MRNHHSKVLELLDSHGPRLYALLVKMTLCQDAAGDLMQELFIRLANSRQFEKAKNPAAYAWRTAINLAFESRRQRKIKFTSLDEICLPAVTDSSALEKIIRVEELRQLLDATSKLPDLTRQVVVMRYIEQEPYEVIARQLGKKPQHLRSICAKALVRLRIFLVKEEI